MNGNVVDIKVASDTLMHVEAIVSAGLLAGPRGSRSVPPSVRLIADALYQLLSGGTVTGTVPGTLTITAGQQAKVADFQNMEKMCLASINQINGSQPYNLVVEI